MHPTRNAPTLLGNSPEFQALLRALQVAAATDVSVLLTGESGTGKEQLARHLHRTSRRSDGPFVAINCAALPESLAESELFGHRRGAFTGATDSYPGRIATATGGTLFLDEVAEMSPAVQAKLLRFLESGEFQPVGELHSRQADVRIVAATHADLARHVEEGRFREDLYYRLNVVPFEVPPLRRRSGDVRLLLEAFSRSLAARHSVAPPRFTHEAVALLEAYSWPGNVRELRNLCERLVILLPGQTVTPDNLPPEIHRSRSRRSWRFRLPEEGVRLEELERELLQQALERTDGNQSRAARLLGLSRYAFIYRLKKHALLG